MAKASAARLSLLAAVASVLFCRSALAAVDISPLPQCHEPRTGHLKLTSAATVTSDDAFSAEWLASGLERAACSGASHPSARVDLLLPSAAQTAALKQRGLHLGSHLGAEGYILDADSSHGVLIAAHNRSGLFHGAQTLLQMLRNGSVPCEVGAARIEDWPAAPMRGVYAVSGWYDAAPPGNVSFLNSTLNRMAESKHSFIMFNANGDELLFSALQNPNMSSTQRTIDYYRHWQAFAADRGIELIPQILAGSSGPNDNVNADIGDGIWVQDEPFVVGGDGQLRAVNSPATPFPTNGDFSDGLAGWKILKHGDIPNSLTAGGASSSNGGKPPPLCWYNASFGPRPGLGSAVCEFTGATPAAPHSLTMGLQSTYFPMDKNGVYAWSAWVRTDTDMTTASEVAGMQFSVYEVGSKASMPPLDYHRGSGQPMGRSSVGTWHQMSGTLLGSEAGNGSGYVLGWLDGNTTTGRFAIADIKILRLNSALVNVVRTGASDINVTSADGGTRYALGTDYTIEDAPKPNQAKDEDLVAAYASGNTFKVRRVPTGKLRVGQNVLLSMDVLGGLVGQIGDGAHLNSFAEPLYYEWMEKVIRFTMRTLKVKRLMFGFDEMHGFNRDSRSRAQGRSNAESLAYAINKLQGAMAAEDPTARAMVWADMLCPFHNGGRPQYQQYSGGIAGATWRAASLLDKRVIVVPWWYSGYDTAEWPVNCSEPNLGKGCTDPGTDCGNVRCAMDNQPTYWGSRGMDWLAAGGTKADNLATWSSLQKGHANALGVMTTQWSSPPNTAGIPFAGEYGWNQAQTQRTANCAT